MNDTKKADDKPQEMQSVNEPAQQVDPLSTPVSINEPPGSNVMPEAKAPEPPPKDEPQPEAADPDELEDEIEQAKEEGDVRLHRGGHGKPHRPNRR